MKIKLFGLWTKPLHLLLSLSSLFLSFQLLASSLSYFDERGKLTPSAHDFLDHLSAKNILTSNAVNPAISPAKLVNEVYQNRLRFDHLDKLELQELEDFLKNLKFLETQPYQPIDESCQSIIVYGAKHIRMDLRVQRVSELLQQFSKQPEYIFLLCSNRPLKDQNETWETSLEWKAVRKALSDNELQIFFPTLAERTEANLLRALSSKYLAPQAPDSQLKIIESTKTRFLTSNRPTTIDTIDSLIDFLKEHQLHLKSCLLSIELPYGHRMALSTIALLDQSHMLPEKIFFDYTYPLEVPLKTKIFEFIKLLDVDFKKLNNTPF